MSAWSEAFAELVRLVPPDVDPILSKGNGTEASAAMELDAILLASAKGVQWSASLVVTYGQVIYPVTRNGRRYRVTVAGTMAVSEPTWPDYDFASLTSGTATLVEDGVDSSSIYDVRRAAREAWMLKASKASEYLRSSDDDDSQIYQRCIEQAQRYASIGVA